MLAKALYGFQNHLFLNISFQLNTCCSSFVPFSHITSFHLMLCLTKFGKYAQAYTDKNRKRNDYVHIRSEYFVLFNIFRAAHCVVIKFTFVCFS